MKSILAFIDGYKTYILSVAIMVYAVLAYFGVAPEPDKVEAAMVIIAGYAITLRSAFGKLTWP